MIRSLLRKLTVCRPVAHAAIHPPIVALEKRLLLSQNTSDFWQSPVIDSALDSTAIEQSRLHSNLSGKSDANGTIIHDSVADILGHADESHEAHDFGHDVAVAWAQPGQVAQAATTVVTNIVAAAAGLTSSIPVLHSLSSASNKIYLDFDGEAAVRWGTYSVSTTPAYSQDSSTTSFSSSEIDSIRQIWQRVSEKFSPFNLDVTTQKPGSGNYVQVVMGGGGGWAGGGGGISYIGAYGSAYPNNISWVFSGNLGNDPHYVAEAAAHEAGHNFGLQHQSSWSGSSKTSEYNPGSGATAPAMGMSYTATRGLWWNGKNSLGYNQDDLSVIASGANGFSYRGDDAGNTIASAKSLTASGSSLSGAGIIERTSDVDFYKFSTGAGKVTLTGSVASVGAMLDLKLKLFSSSGAQIASADTSSLGETLTANVAAGTYFLGVYSKANYGDIGKYTISGSSAGAGAAPAYTLNAPGNVAATAVNSSQISLSWSDTSTGESGYKVERSTNGSSWTEIYRGATSNQTTYTATGLKASTTYYFRIHSYVSGIANGNYSAVANAKTSGSAPAPTVILSAPTGVWAQVVSSSQITLNWNDTATGESGYKVERSTNGSNWTEIYRGTTNSQTSYTATGLNSGTTYYFRVRAYLSGVASGTYSNTISAKTASTTAPSVSLAVPTGVWTQVISSSQIKLTWNDTSTGESGYKVERSTNGYNWTEIYRGTTNSQTTYTASGLNSGTTYYFRVRAYLSGVSNSGYSNTVSSKTAGASGWLAEAL